jgi:hypothetical protein
MPLNPIFRLEVAMFLVVLAPFAVSAQNAPPTPDQLIERAKGAEKAQSERGWKYTYREDSDVSELDNKGQRSKTIRKTYEHIMLEGTEYKKLILIDGKTLDAKTQQNVDEDLEKERIQRKKGGPGSGFSRTFSVEDLDRVARFFQRTVTGEEMMLARKTWRMESEPNPGSYKPADKQEEQALATRQTIWFDQQDGVKIKEHIEFIRAANGFQPGSTTDFENVRIGDEWLLDNATFRMDVKLLLAIHPRAEIHVHFYDYKRFTVDSAMHPE